MSAMARATKKGTSDTALGSIVVGIILIIIGLGIETERFRATSIVTGVVFTIVGLYRIYDSKSEQKARVNGKFPGSDLMAMENAYKISIGLTVISAIAAISLGSIPNATSWAIFVGVLSLIGIVMFRSLMAQELDYLDFGKYLLNQMKRSSNGWVSSEDLSFLLKKQRSIYPFDLWIQSEKYGKMFFGSIIAKRGIDGSDTWFYRFKDPESATKFYESIAVVTN